MPVTRDNRYLVGLVDNSLQYVASINGIKDIYSNNSIELSHNKYGSYQVAANYDMGGEGILKQKIVENGYNSHPMTLSEARVNGDFNLTSRIENENQMHITDIDYSSPEYLASKLSFADKSIETAQNAGRLTSAENIGGKSFVTEIGRFVPLRVNSSEVIVGRNLRGIIFNRPAGCMIP